MGTSNPKYLVLDTPNVLLYHSHRGEKQLIRSQAALVNLICNERDYRLSLAITPLMKRSYSDQLPLFSRLIDLNNHYKFETKNHDPDIDIIEKAEQLDGYILSNDLFRKHKDYTHFVKYRRIGYEIENYTIVIDAKN